MWDRVRRDCGEDCLHASTDGATLANMNTTTQNLYGITTGDVVLIIQPGGESSEKLVAEIVTMQGAELIWITAEDGLDRYIGKDFTGTVIVNGERRHADGTVNAPTLMTDMLTTGGAR